MPNFQVNINITAKDQDAQRYADAARAAVEAEGATIQGCGFVSMAKEVEVSVVNTETQEIRTETVLANDDAEARELVELGPNEFAPKAQVPGADVEGAVVEEEPQA